MIVENTYGITEATPEKEVDVVTQGQTPPEDYWQQTRSGVPSMYINIAIALVIGYFIYQQR